MRRTQILRKRHRQIFQESPAGKRSSSMVYVILVAYLLSLAYEGPLRTALSLTKLENLLYLRDLAALIIVLFYSRPAAWRGIFATNLTTVSLYVILCHSVIGLWLGHPLAPVLFTIKIFTSCMFGMSAAHHLENNEQKFAKILIFIFIGSVIGVFINTAGQLPWEGSEYENAFGTVRNARLWWSDGVRRLPGFSRASYSAASIIGLTGVFLSAYAKDTTTKILVFAVGMPAIYLTTSKGVIISYAIVTGWALIPNNLFKRASAANLNWIFSITAIALPAITAIIAPNPGIIRSVPKMLGSFAERAALTWPEALRGLDKWYEWVVGQGIGGVASPLRYGPEMWMFNPIDNFPLYFFMNFGIMGIAYYIFLTHRISKLNVESTPYQNGLVAMGLLIYSYGITAHLLEDAFVSILFGILVAHPTKDKYIFKERFARTQK